MVNFAEAFKEGLTAAEKADRARKEIDSVFVDLNMQIHESTEGKIKIDRKILEGVIKIGRIPVKKETYWAIVAYNPKIAKSPVKELAEWKEDRAGYPCKIDWRNEQHICEDKEALENTLAELLRDPIVGEILNTLSKLEDNPMDGEIEN